MIVKVVYEMGKSIAVECEDTNYIYVIGWDNYITDKSTGKDVCYWNGWNEDLKDEYIKKIRTTREIYHIDWYRVIPRTRFCNGSSI